MQKNLYKRLAQIEAVATSQKAESEEILLKVYAAACEDKNEDEAAALARKIRDKLLDISDKQMTLDRLELETTTATKFIASLAKILTGDWAKYRQALRDLPEQEGFPFDVVFPTPPATEESSEK
jgi:alkanesulfonate monooxygenase SsuD/methylene tetrahydromethanopterin reductase-like flavin-dependent oxidoreductase (luciferase family)